MLVKDIKGNELLEVIDVPEWHYEYGGLYGITLPEGALAHIEMYRTDKEEVEKIAFGCVRKDVPYTGL